MIMRLRVPWAVRVRSLVAHAIDEDAAALLPDCAVLSDDASRRLAHADGARRGFGAWDAAALRALRDGVLAAPMLEPWEEDPRERG